MEEARNDKLAEKVLSYQETKDERLAAEILKEYGFHRYEISNYATPGRECRHNSSYSTATVNCHTC